jgi:hypothetical protein
MIAEALAAHAKATARGFTGRTTNYYGVRSQTTEPGELSNRGQR